MELQHPSVKYHAINNSLAGLEKWDFLAEAERDAYDKLGVATCIDEIINIDFDAAIVAIKNFDAKREREFEPQLKTFLTKVSNVRATILVTSDYI